MKTLISILILATIFPSLNQAQTARHSRQQNATSDQSKVEAQRHYDPLAGHTIYRTGRWTNSSIRSIRVTAISGRLSPTPVNDWSSRLPRTPISGSPSEQSFTILLLVSYIFWLFRQRNDRLEISVNIVTQLANSYLYTRSRAIDAISRHNRLVDDYSALAEKQSRRQEANSNSLTAVVSDSLANSTIEIPVQTAAPFAQVESPPKQSADKAPATEVAADGEFMTKKQVKALVEDTKRTSTLGAKHQISALTQQVQNLREQLNQALTQVQHCEKQHRRSVGA